MFRHPHVIALALSLMAAPGIAQEPATAEEHDLLAAADADSDGRLTDTEFRDFAEATFTNWDANDDDRLEGGEFVAGLMEQWSNGGDLDPSAFETGWTTWFQVADRPDFAATDQNSDGSLSQDELRVAVETAVFHGMWQGASDTYLTPAEFQVGLQAVIDRIRLGQGG